MCSQTRSPRASGAALLMIAAKLVLRTLPICGVTHHRTPCTPGHAKESVGKLLAARFSLHPPSGTDGRFFGVDRLGGPALISFRGRARGWRSWPSRSRWADLDVCRAPRPPCCPAVLDTPLLPPCCCSHRPCSLATCRSSATSDAPCALTEYASYIPCSQMHASARRSGLTGSRTTGASDCAEMRTTAAPGSVGRRGRSCADALLTLVRLSAPRRY